VIVSNFSAISWREDENKVHLDELMMMFALFAS